MASYFKSRGILRPHPHQRAALASLLWGMRRCRFRQLALDYRWPDDEPGRSQICVLPTGTGKTIVFGFLAGFLAARKKRPRRVLILAHRETLIQQAADKLGFLGIATAVEKADKRARQKIAIYPEIRVVVGSVQTMKGKRLYSWPQDYFDTIIIDEAHHATASGYRAILDWFVRAKVVGVTATDRADGIGLGRIFDRKAYEMTLPEAIGGGWLVPVLGVRSDVKVDLKGLRSKGDYLDAQLEERINRVIGPLAIATRKEIGDRKTIVFTPTVKTAQAFADALCQLGVSAKATHGEDPAQSKTLEQFRNGEFRVLCNCALLTEGYDEPGISAVVIARPTKSSTLLMQMIGRGTRLHPDSGKKDCLIIDFGWEVDQSKVKTVLDLFVDDKADPADVATAREYLAATPDGKAVDPQELLEKAKQAREAKEAKRERDKVRVKVKDREISYRRVTFDVVGVRSIVGGFAPPVREGVVGMPVGTDAAAKLKQLGYDSTDGMTQREAAAMIGTLEQRSRCGMSTLPQIKILTRAGYDHAKVSEMTKAEAGAIIGPLTQRRKLAGKRSG